MSIVQKEYPVIGMHCAMCAMNVEKTTSALEGVKQANVNFSSDSLTITYDTDKTTPENLQEAVKSIGFELIVKDDNQLIEAEERAKKNYKRLKKEVIFAWGITLLIWVLSMHYSDIKFISWIIPILTAILMIVSGKKFYVGAFNMLRQKKSSMDTLIALSTSITFLFSLFNTFFPDFWTQHGLKAGIYFDSVGMIISFVLLGKLLEARAKSATTTSIKNLIKLQPTQAIVIENGQDRSIALNDIRPGMFIRIRPGEQIPIDGKVTEGNSYVNEQMINGEPIPNFKEVGSQLYAGTMNQRGSLIMKAETLGSETVLAKIISSVKAAQASKAPIQSKVDRVAAIFVPAILIISLITAATWLFVGGTEYLSNAFLTAVSVLVIACPCAMGLATPTALTVGLGRAASNHLLIKDAEALEKLGEITDLVFDKTGTLTEGKPKVSNWYEPTKLSELEYSLILMAEKQSEHPLASSVVKYILENYPQTESINLTNFETVSGLGVSFSYNGINYRIGNSKFSQLWSKVDENSELAKKANHWMEQGKAISFVENDSNILTVIAFQDTIKQDAVTLINKLKKKKITPHLISGDNTKAVATLANQLGIEQAFGNMLPAEKEDYIKQLKDKKKVVAMVGDGINDTQALASADVSIAMSEGTGIAIDVAMVTLIGKELNYLFRAISLSRHTISVMNSNLGWAFIYNILMIPIAAGILYPFGYTHLLSPSLAAAAMAFSSISVVINSLMLKFYDLD